MTNQPTNAIPPILAEINGEGRLLRADDALRRLNQRAGGEDGGIIAVPALLAIAQLSLRLNMRLARPVRVADNADYVELWVEAQPKGDVAHLSIRGWRNLYRNETEPSGDDDFGEASVMYFDSASRLVRCEGAAIDDLSAADFGSNVAQLCAKLFANGTEVQDALANIRSKKSFGSIPLTLNSDGSNVEASGTAAPVAGTAAVYRLRLERNLQVPDAADGSRNAHIPGAMFGKHLAPVLRQPLGRIIANAETIGGELQGPIRENYAEYARDIANAARHLSALVDDLGDLEAIERADFKTAPDNIELGDLARRTAGLLALKAADHSIRILAPAADIKVPAVAEFRRVLQILLNLVTNAVRYSPDGTEVRLDVGIEDDWAVISVSDQGFGIKAHDAEKIFQKFERLGRSGDGGSGLGLYISRRLARAMRGDLSVAEAEGGGAKFTLRLPRN
jgi:signal transduction histidine kinase